MIQTSLTRSSESKFGTTINPFTTPITSFCSAPIKAIGWPDAFLIVHWDKHPGEDFLWTSDYDFESNPSTLWSDWETEKEAE